VPLYADITSEDNPRRLKSRAEAYAAYLKTIAEFLPAETREFALSDWYYDHSNWDRCPHDAWVESVELLENFSGERKEQRNVGIKIRLLAASQADHILFTYDNVFGYALNFLPNIQQWDGNPVLPKHADWMADEISLNSLGHVVHEIHFSSGCVWKIEAERISCTFTSSRKD
jgi:hypothetical protein